MNWVLIAVLAVLIFYMFYGYQKGILRIAYSMVAWVLQLVLVTVFTPYIAAYLVQNTSVYTNIQQRCEERLRQASAGRLEAIGSLDAIQGDTFAQMGINLPEVMIEEILSGAAETTNGFLEGSGIYQTLSSGMADFVVDGISFLLSFIGAAITVGIISYVLGIVSYIPIVKDANRLAGILAGGACGLMIVWIAFTAIAFCSSSEQGAILVSFIQQSAFLIFLYENNPILACILKFL